MAIKADGSTGNLLKVWRASTQWERGDGLNYYAQQRNNIVAITAPYDMGLAASIGAFAALSPNNDEAGNYRDLSRCAEYVALSTGVEDLPIVSTYPANRDKAIKMLRGAFPDNVLRGPKTIAFYHNTLDPRDPYWVTIDGHMVSAWLGRRVLLRRRTDADDGRESAEINRAQYESIASDLRDAAKIVHVLPAQFQATAWIAWKRLNNIRYTPQLKFQW